MSKAIIFNYGFINKTQNLGIDKAYNKSCMAKQAHNIYNVN